MGVVCFSDGGEGVGGGGCPVGGGISFGGGGGVEKNCKMRGALAPSMPLPRHYGKPCVLILNFCFACSLLLCMFSACMFYFTNITNV